MTGQQALLNQRTGCYIDNLNRIINRDGGSYSIVGFGDGDVNLIEINDVYHTVIMGDDGYLTLVTDYGFTFSYNYQFQYYINYPNPDYLDTINFIDYAVKELKEEKAEEAKYYKILNFRY